MKAFWSIILILIVLGILVGVTRGIHSTSATGATPAAGGLATRLQQCPDQLIINNMPGPGEQKTSYYILKGERHEISEFDDQWVAKNCQVPTQAVY